MTRIVLIGAASHWKEAPFTDPECEIWGAGTTAPGEVPRWDVWFDIHNPGGMASNLLKHPAYAKFLTTVYPDKTIYTNGTGPEAGIPSGRQYPREEMFDKYGEQFFRSSFDWMGYLALEETIKRGGKVIEAYGFDMAHESEYADQRPSAQHFIWVAEEMHGIEVVLPPDSKLRNHPRPYGLDPSPLQKDIERRVQTLSERLRDKRALLERVNQEALSLEGAITSLTDLSIANYGVKPKQ